MILRKSGKFSKRIFAWYLILYGIGRVWIEGLRTDSLYLWNSGIRVSQALSAAMIIIGVFMLFWFGRKMADNEDKTGQNKE